MVGGGFFGSGGKSNSGNSTTTNETNSTNLNVGGGGGDVGGNIDLSSYNSRGGNITIEKSDMGAVAASFDFARDFSAGMTSASKGIVDSAINMASEKSRGELENVTMNLQKYAFFAVAAFLAVQVFKVYKGSK
jgi:hypothetical protein